MRSRDGSPEASLSNVGRVYSFWGRHPMLYAASDLVTFLGRAGRVRGAAVTALGVGRGASVLEVACGTGRNLGYIEARIGPTGRLVGFDHTEAMLIATELLCRQHAWSNVTLVQGDAAVLDVGAEPFDAVLCVLGMSVVPDHVAALRRCHEVLRPGGVLSVCDARLFPDTMSVLNPLVRAVYTRLAAWVPDRNIPEAMRRIFGNVSVETFNLGNFFVAASRRQAAP